MLCKSCPSVEQLALDQDCAWIFLARFLLIFQVNTCTGFATPSNQVINGEDTSLTGRELHLNLLCGLSVQQKCNLNSVCFVGTVHYGDEPAGTLLGRPHDCIVRGSVPVFLWTLAIRVQI